MPTFHMNISGPKVGVGNVETILWWRRKKQQRETPERQTLHKHMELSYPESNRWFIEADTVFSGS